MENIDEKLYWFYETAIDTPNAVSIAENILDSSNLEIKVITLASNQNLIEILSKAKEDNYDLKITSKGNKLYKITLNKKRRNKTRLSGCFLLSSSEYAGIYNILTFENMDFVKNGIISFFNLYYPLVSPIYIDSNFMKNLLSEIEKELLDSKDPSLADMGIRSTRISSKSRIIKKDAMKEIESDLKWTDEPFEDTFINVFSNNEWVNSIDFILTPKMNIRPYNLELFDGIKCYLARNGLFKCNKKINFFYSTLINKISINAEENLKFFSNRERKGAKNLSPNPISIEFENDIFQDKAQNKKLIETLRDIPYSSVSVIHGNPYLHCSFLDNRDGSSYDLWVLSHNKIIIVPQMKSSFASLGKLCDSIFIGFREGNIKEFTGAS